MSSSAQLVAALRRLLGDAAVVTTPDALATYDADASMIVARAPEAVALPATPEQAAAAVALAVAAGVPVVARGAGTGIAGGAVPVRGGLVLSTARLDRVESVDARSRRAVVQPGVVNAELNARLAPLGLQFAPDPSSQRASTIGGNLATNAGGPHCLKYGVTTNHVLAVELVRPDGARVWTGDGAPDAAGYDLTGLVVGSEGTFGLVTRAMLRLTPLPEANRVVLALFPSVVAASAAVSRVIAAGSLPTSLEVMDHNAIRAVNGAYGLGLPEDEGTTLLIVEVDGVEDGLDATLEQILALCAAEGAFELRPARTLDEQARVWAARKSVAGAIGRLAPAYLLVDTVVPRTRLPLMMERIEALRRQHAMEVCNVFHAGDGNLHPLVLYDPRDPGQVERAHAIAKAALELSIAEGGVISGEHGIGLEKQDYLPLLFSPEELQLQATVYTVFNPGDHFNPAKIFPAAWPPAELAARRRARLETGRPGDGETGRPRDLAVALATIVGAKHVAEGEGGLTVSPGSLDALSRAVALCHAAGVAVIPTGSGSPGLRVSLRRMARVLTYEPDDLTIGVEAGMSLAELRAVVGANGQQLPLEVADERASLGALVAAAAEGPRRLGYGTMRDWALALTVVEPDGAVVRLGAQVVKNVTGYDLVKLYVGSRGTLGVIAAVSLRLFPLAPASATLVAGFADRAAALGFLDDLAASRLQPTACEYLEGVRGGLPGFSLQPSASSPHEASLILRAEGGPAAVARHVAELRAMAAARGAVAAAELGGDEEARLWRGLAGLGAAGAPPGGARIRLGVAPGELGAALGHARAEAAARGVRLAASARALAGVVYLLAEGPDAGLRGLHAALVERWRHAALLAAAPAVREGLPLWGAPPAALDLMAALKRAIDPYDRMCPGSYIV